ncbi:MAG: cohesin domain-containing protein [Bacteroidota bacterium]
MRKIFSFLGILWIVLLSQSSPIKAQNINTTLGSVTGVCVGDTVVVPVTVTMGTGISTSAISMAIDYDSTKLRCISSVTSLNANIATGFLSNCGLFSNLTPGTAPFTPTTRRQFRAAWFALVPVAFNGVMFNLRFVAIANTTGSSPIAWDINTAGNCEYADELADVIPNCTFVNGSATISSPAAITTQPSGVTSLTAGGNTTLTVVASGNPTYQWQQLTSGGSWTNLANGGSFAGVTTATLSITNASASLNGNQYRVIVTGGCGAAVTSNALTLSVAAANATGLTVGGANGCQGDTVSVPVSVSGLNGVTALTLKINLPSGTSFVGLSNTVAGLSTATAAVNAGQLTITWSGAPFTQASGSLMNLRFVLGAQGGTLAWDNATTITPNATLSTTNGTLGVTALPVVITQPVATLTVAEFLGATISAVTNNATNFRWQKQDVGSTAWNDLTDNNIYSGTGSAVLTISSANLTLNGVRYRLRMSAGSCPNQVNSGVCTLTVTPMQITLNALGANACAGDTVIVPVRVSGANAISNMSIYLIYSASNLTFLPTLSDSVLNANISVQAITSPTPRIFISYNAGPSINMNQTTLVRLRFRALGTSALTWSNNSDFSNSIGDAVALSQITGVSSSVSVTQAVVTAAGSTSFCTGGSVVLNGNTIAGATYQWLNASGPISGATNASYTATTAGSYRMALSVAGGCSDTSAPVTVTTSAPPTAAITPSGPTTFCQGGNVGLVATRGNGFTYRWYRDNTRLTNLAPNQDSIGALLSGTYRVVVINTGNCSDSTATGVVVTVKVKPRPPIVTRPSTPPASDSLFTNIRNQNNITWFRNGVALTGGANGALRITANGIYRAVQDSNGCRSDSSNAYIVTGINVFENEASSMGLGVFPNPSRGWVTLSGRLDEREGKTSITVTNLSGQIAARFDVEDLSGAFSHPMDLSHLAPGVYMITLQREDRRAMIRFIRE